jgi:crossover junction endodeoxyribonuclease RuvC
MRILGLDPGTALLGWGVIDHGTQEQSDRSICVGYGCIITDKSMTDSQRLLAIGQGLEKIITENMPELVSVEKLFFSNNQKTVMTVSQARGVILYTIEKMGLPCVEYTPQEVKQSLTGYGKADKAQIQHMTKMILRLDHIPKPDDAADALAIAITAAQHQQFARRIRTT